MMSALNSPFPPLDLCPVGALTDKEYSFDENEAKNQTSQSA